MATYPNPNDVLYGVVYGPSDTDYTGKFHFPLPADVHSGVGYGRDIPGATPPFEWSGEYDPNYPPTSQILYGTNYGDDNALTGGYHAPGAGDVRLGVGYGADAPGFTPPFDFVGEYSATADYPDPQYVLEGVSFDSDSQSGTLHLPDVSQVLSGVVYGSGGSSLTGTLTGGGGTIPATADVRYGTAVGSGGTGSLRVPATSKVLSGELVDATSGTLTLPSVGNVRSGTNYGISGTGSTGTLAVPATNKVLSGEGVDSTTGSLTLPTADKVQSGTVYGVGGTGSTGTLVVGGTGVIPAASDVRYGVSVGDSGSGTLRVPSAGDVRSGVGFDVSATGTLVVPAAGNVRVGIQYGAAGTQYTGTVVIPAAANVRSGTNVDTSGSGTLVVPVNTNVRSGIGYGSAGTEFTGNMTLPAESDVASGVNYGGSGTEYVGSLGGEESDFGMPLENQTFNFRSSIFATKTFSSPGLVITGWTKFVFTMKRDASQDEDEDSAIVIVKTSGGSGSDGLAILNARDVASGDYNKASITVDSDSPNGTVTVNIEPIATIVMPSPDSKPYDWEINYWDAAGRKRVFASGTAVVTRGVRRSPAIP